MTATVHSDGADGSVKTITLAATGTSTGRISIADTAGATEAFDLYDVAADPVALKMTCKANVLFQNPYVAIAVRTTAGKAFVDMTITHVLFGGGTTTYPIRQSEDLTLQAFLKQSAFPLLVA